VDNEALHIYFAYKRQTVLTDSISLTYVVQFLSDVMCPYIFVNDTRKTIENKATYIVVPPKQLEFIGTLVNW